MYLFFRTRIPRIVTNGIVRGSLLLLRMAEPQGSFVRIRAIRVRLIQLMCLYLLVLLISFPNTNPTNCHEWNRAGFFAPPPHGRATRLIRADSCYSCSSYTIDVLISSCFVNLLSEHESHELSRMESCGVLCSSSAWQSHKAHSCGFVLFVFVLYHLHLFSIRRFSFASALPCWAA